MKVRVLAQHAYMGDAFKYSDGLTRASRTLGDGSAAIWLNDMLGEGVKESKILDYKLLATLPGVWGLVLNVFTVDLDVPEPITFEDASERAGALIGDVLHDSLEADPWVSPLP